MPAVNKQQEVCPNCGNFADVLMEETGWCRSCNVKEKPIKSNAATTGLCLSCGRTSGIQKRCRQCREILWLERNADEIELIMALGLSAEQAIRAVISRNGAANECIVCGDPIKYTAMICNGRPQCRVAKRRFKYLVYEKNISRDDAFILVKETFSSVSISGRITE